MDWQLYLPGVFLTFAGLIGVFLSFSGLARTFLEGFHSLSGLALALGLILLVAGVLKGGAPASAKDRAILSLTFVALVSVGTTGALTTLGGMAPPSLPPPPPPPAQTVTVDIVKGAASPTNDKFYEPATITVVIGVNNTVRWTNSDPAPHTVTAVDGSFDSKNMNFGDVFTWTFTQPGTYNYVCLYHPWMKGTVIVRPRA